MLVCHWAFESRDQSSPQLLVRLHVLSQLLEEFYGYVHMNLTAGVLLRQLFVVPFFREIKIEAPGVANVLLSVLQYCRRTGGVLIVAPEQRLSMLLKRLEIRFQLESQDSALEEGERQVLTTVMGVLATIEGLPYADVFDESDEILRHRFQLIYAIGAPLPLPDGADRWHAVFALLEGMTHMLDHPQSLLRQHPLAFQIDRCSDDASASFAATRFLAGLTLEECVPELYKRLIDGVFERPPRHFDWIKDHSGENQERMKVFIIDPLATAVSCKLDQVPMASVAHMQALLALRGLLAHHVLVHCMLKQHRVDYGVDMRAWRKRLAVPFSASDTPTDRSEFAHVDAALLLTTLSYYAQGLSKQQVRDAFDRLFILGKTAQQELYGDMFSIARVDLSDEEITAMDTVAKIDLTDPQVLTKLHSTFGRNREMVNFWLANVVFPNETKQYPSRLVATPWHLVDARNPDGVCVGFSGTNDTKRLLPLPVRQHQVEGHPMLRGTNGRMMSLGLRNKEYIVLEPGPLSQWKRVISVAVKGGFHALIDAGALLSGVSNRGVAEALLRVLDPCLFKGVVFFDKSVTRGNSWLFVDAGGREWPLDKSPIKEREALCSSTSITAGVRT
jgi:hypothetical protein